MVQIENETYVEGLCFHEIYFRKKRFRILSADCIAHRFDGFFWNEPVMLIILFKCKDCSHAVKPKT